MHDPEGGPDGIFKNTNDDYQTAIQQLYSAIGWTHPAGDIPLSRIKVNRFGPYTMMGTAIYAHPRSSGGGGTTVGLLASYVGGTTGIQVYRSAMLTPALPKVTDPGPLTLVQPVVTADPSGKPSSLTVPINCT